MEARLRGIVLAELNVSASVVLGGAEVTPRLRVIGAEGQWTIFAPLPDDIGERQRRMQLLHRFMVWKSAWAFVLSTELMHPALVVSTAVWNDGVLVAGRPYVQKPLTVGPVEWLPRNLVGDEVTALLPRGRMALDDDSIGELEAVFGAGSELEARSVN
jgi:hypothetical protein